SSPTISGCVSVLTTSASPPPRRTNSANHSAACSTSPACAGSALTLGMRTSSASSSNQASAMAGESTPGLRPVAERYRVGERARLLQALVLDLPDPLAGDVERPPHLVERPRMLAVQPVAKLEDAALSAAQRVQHALERRLAQLDLGHLLGQRLVLVGQEVPELGL